LYVIKNHAKECSKNKRYLIQFAVYFQLEGRSEVFMWHQFMYLLHILCTGCREVIRNLEVMFAFHLLKYSLEQSSIYSPTDAINTICSIFSVRR